MKKILALDLSLSATGYCVGRFTTGTLEPPKTAARGCERLDWILNRVLELVHGHAIDLVVIEGYAFQSQSSHVRAIGELGGLVRWGLWKSKVQFAEVPPSSLKQYATGKGNAGKPEMLVSAIKRLNFLGHDDNEADALWLWHMGHDAYGAAPVQLPQTHRAALEKIHWPGLPPPPPKPKKKRRVS